MRKLEGVYPALVTPLDDSGAFDPIAMRKIVRYQMDAGVDGFYVCGGTGEGLLLPRAEREKALQTVVDEVQGQAGVIAHVGAFQTTETLALARHASTLGVDAIAALPPAYFYKPDTLALVRYYSAVAAASAAPLLVYNIPQRTSVTMTAELFDRLMAIENVVGMKDSSGNLYTLGLLCARDSKPVIFEGDDTVLLPALLAGACGGIGASYNLMPRLFVRVWQAFQAGDMAAASAAQLRINEIISALLTVELIAGVKQTLDWMGLPCGQPRSPIRPLTDEETARLRRALEGVGFFDAM